MPRETESSETELVQLAQSLPGTGEGVLCSPNVLQPGDPAAAIGREPHSSDIPGDYCYLALGSEWKQAAPKLLSAAAALYGSSPEVAADARALKEMLDPQLGGANDVTGAGDAVQSLRVQTPPAPTGPHITIRSNLRPIELLPSSDWRFRVMRVVSFTNPKLGQPSQWDKAWYCARWVALEVEWLGSCANKQRGGWPHVAIGSFGFRIPAPGDAGSGHSFTESTRRRKSSTDEGERQRKKHRETTESQKPHRRKAKTRRSKNKS